MRRDQILEMKYQRSKNRAQRPEIKTRRNQRWQMKYQKSNAKVQITGINDQRLAKEIKWGNKIRD